MFKTKLHVSGTEGTHNYAVINAAPLGFVAVRLLNSDLFRVRVEPASPEAAHTIGQYLSRSVGWKQPGDSNQNRFSIVCSASKLHHFVGKAISALNNDEDSKADSDWSGALAAVAMVGSTDRNVLIERLRRAKVAGVNSVSNWTTTTLVAKFIAIAYESYDDGEHGALAAWVKASSIPGANLACQWSTETLRKKALLA